MSRTYVVTGSASGMGKATAEHLRAQGHTVIGVDLRGAHVNADLSSEQGRTAMVEEVTQRSGGRLDGVLAVAGLAGPSPLTVKVNYFGAKATLEGLRPLLAASDAPRAAVVASYSVVQEVDDALLEACLADDESAAVAEAERIGTATNAVGSSPIYSSSKRAIARWVRSHAKDPEWAGAGIALNAIAPGVINTPMIAETLATPEGLAAMSALAPTPLNGPAAPATAPAKLLAWLTSEENTHVTGQVIFIDGGTESILRPEVV